MQASVALASTAGGQSAGEDYVSCQHTDRTALRRITVEHRLVSIVIGDDLVILQARYRY